MADEELFVKLINEHRGILYKICNIYADTTADRQDLQQDILFQLWRSFPAFRGDSQFSTWMYRIGLNTAIGGLRRKKKIIESYNPRLLPEAFEDDIEGKEKQSQLDQLYKALNFLSSVEKALVMFYLDDKSYDEMEEILGISQNTLRVKMNRVKEKLRKLTKQAEHGT